MTHDADQTEGTAPAPGMSTSKKVWLVVVGFLLLGTYANLVIPAMVGRGPQPISGYTSMFWNGLFFYLWLKWRRGKGWLGAVLGLTIGIVAFGAAAFLAGFMRHA